MRITNERGITIVALIIEVVILVILIALVLDLVFDKKEMEDAAGDLSDKIVIQENTMNQISEEVRDKIENLNGEL